MGAFDFDVCLHASRALANEAVRAPLDSAAPSEATRAGLGVLHTTPFDLAVSQWELWGDGRRLVEDQYRLIRVYGLLEKHGLQASLGTAAQVSALVKKHLAGMQEAGFEAAGLARREAAACRLAAEYCESIREAGMVELCQALGSMREAVSRMSIRVMEPCVLDEPLAGFYADVLGRPPSARLEPDVPEGPFRADFALLKPQGATVVHKMLFEEVRAAVAKGASSVAVVSPDPLSAYESLADPLREAGASCAVEASLPFSRTGFGGFYLSACKLLALAGLYGVDKVVEPEDESWVDVATDVALSGYAGISPFDAGGLPSLSGRGAGRVLRSSDLNTVWRADRTLTAADAVADLAEVSEGFRRVRSALLAEGAPDAPVAGFRDDAARMHSGLALQFESAAISSLEAVLGYLRTLGAPPFQAALFPEGMSVSASCIDDPCAPGSALVRFVPLDSARKLAAASYDETVLCDVTDAFLNAKDPRTAADFIALKFGLPVRGSKLERVRQAFSCAMASARDRFACVFPMRDADSQESFTSFAFDEFVDRVFEGCVASQQIVRGVSEEDVAGLPGPAFFDDGASCSGEERFVEGVGRRLEKPVRHERIRLAERGRLSSLSLPERLPHAASEGQAPLVALSPSAIEAYLDCPYKWFLERVVNPKGLDEQFGPLEKGNFAHALLEGFYVELKSRFGASRIDEADPADARELFEEVVRAALADGLSRSPNSGRLAPASNVEVASARMLAEDVYASILLHANLPRRFGVGAVERRIGGLDLSCESAFYAGFALVGKVDRIDVDPDAGSFCVIDYKGTVASHAAGDACVSVSPEDGSLRIDPRSLPRHVQALVYAQALARSAGCGAPCAALYTSYRAKGARGLVAGSYESPGSGMSSISGASSSVGMDFSAFLDLVEDAVAARASGVMRSEIPAEPSFPDACEHCCFSLCERRP